jgi:hypothetical protein
MIVSLNEIETVVLKACRGAGMSWGLAEDAAQAARWLAGREPTWDASLATLLAARQAETVSVPSLANRDIRATRPQTALCAIHSGAVVSDLLGLHGRLMLHDVLAPLWLLPFAARHAGPDCDVALIWHGGRIHLHDNDVHHQAGPHRLGAGRLATLTVERVDRAGATAVPGGAPHGGIAVDEAAWASLLQLGTRTYVPASIHSRATGAGAGLLDND